MFHEYGQTRKERVREIVGHCNELAEFCNDLEYKWLKLQSVLPLLISTSPPRTTHSMSAPYSYSSGSESDDDAPEVVSQASARQGRKEQARLARLANEQ